MASELLRVRGAAATSSSFGTTAETRNGGGFVGAYGVLEADDGRLDLTEAGDLNDLNPKPGCRPGDGRIRLRRPPPTGRSATGPTTSTSTSGTWPSARTGRPTPTSSPSSSRRPRAARRSTGRSTPTPGGGRPARAHRPVSVPGIPRPSTPSNVEQYLLVDQYIEFDPLDPARKDVLGDVAGATFDALSSRPLPGSPASPTRSAPSSPAATSGCRSPTPAAEAFLDETGLSGRWGRDPAPTTCRCGRPTASPTRSTPSSAGTSTSPRPSTRPGHASAKSSPSPSHNNAPASGLPAYIIGNQEGLPPGTSRDLVTVHTPHRLAGSHIDGQAAGSLTQTEFGEHVHTAVAQAPPGGSTTVEFTLDGTVEPGPYRLDVLPQPMTEPDRLDLRVDDGSSHDRLRRRSRPPPALRARRRAGGRPEDPTSTPGLLVAIVAGGLLAGSSPAAEKHCEGGKTPGRQVQDR